MIWATPERRTRFTFELFLISFLALFAELVVIRWLASEVRVFAYYRIDFSPLFLEAPAEPGGAVQVGYNLDVNRDFHPAILDLGRRFHRERPYRVDGVRVINYVYTVESLREAIGHLTPRGIIALSSFRRAGEHVRRPDRRDPRIRFHGTRHPEPDDARAHSLRPVLVGAGLPGMAPGLDEGLTLRLLLGRSGLAATRTGMGLGQRYLRATFKP